MTRVRAKGEAVRNFVVQNLTDHPRDICRVAMKHFGITRQAMTRHLRNMIKDGQIVREGKPTRCVYRLAQLSKWQQVYELHPRLSESDIWIRDIKGRLGAIPENAASIWHWGFTEMMNNAIDHSGGKEAIVVIERTAGAIRIAIHDDGVGIFRKIQAHLGLVDERHAVLELAKGKFTTDPRRHSGQGIFFTSRMFDHFQILSGGVFYSHEEDREGDFIMGDPVRGHGTSVLMTLSNHTSRTAAKVFRQYQDEDLRFIKTVVPVRLARYGDDNLVSRSQARRLLAGMEKFESVVLDLEGVETIGQAFADETFRVFPSQHPGISLRVAHANAALRRMIAKATSDSSPDPSPGS